MNGDLKTTFIQQSLAEYMIRVIDAMKVYSKRHKINFTGDAMRSLSYQLMKLSEGQGTANLSFNEYLRFVDMGVGKGHPLGGMKSMSDALSYKRRMSVKNTSKAVSSLKRNPKKIYSRIAYGNLTWLQNQLLYGYTEETIQMLKNTIKE